MLDYIMLGMVLDENKTGYDIKKYIENGIGVFYKASYGSLYPALQKLTDKGFLERLEKPQGGRKKIFYQITAEGRAVFFAWLTAPMQVLEGTNTHLAKVYFFDKLEPDTRDRLLAVYEINNTNYLMKLRALEENFDRMENKSCFYYKLSTLYYGICVVQETIRWCRHIRAGKILKELMEDLPIKEGSMQ